MRVQYLSKLVYGLCFVFSVAIQFAKTEDGSGDDSGDTNLPIDFYSQIGECYECNHEKYHANFTKFDCAMAREDRVGLNLE